MRKLYGLDQKHTSDFGSRCLLARRLVERGVRFVQSIPWRGPVSMQWDAHKDLIGNHEKMCGLTDLPVAALLKDLKQRGLLDSTLVIWGSRVRASADVASRKRTRPQSARFHYVVCGRRREARDNVGETDDLGVRGVGDRYSMRDFHATLLHLLGLDQNQLWFLHNGRHEKLTDFGGVVIEDMIA